MCSAASLREQQKGLLERIHQLNVDIGKLSAGLSSDRCCQLTGQPSGLKPCETVVKRYSGHVGSDPENSCVSSCLVKLTFL